ncbi:MAG: ParM/StbA family protein [Huintestinicola sp.]
MAARFNGIYIIAADTGNGNVKTVSTCTPTSVSRFDTKPITTTNVMQYNGSYYVIGQGHKEVISDKTQDEDYYILTLFCIAKELARDNVTEASVIIAAGLPITWFGNQAESYRSYLKQNSEVEFSLNGTAYKVFVRDAVILPQGYAAIIENLGEMKGDNMLADIGNGTINILRIRNGVVIEDSLHTEMLGVNECVKEILHSLKDKTFTDVDESVALDFIKTGESSILEVYVDEMKRIISIYCGKVMKLLTRNGYNRNFMNLYICGGGARVMKKFCPAVANDDKVFLMTNICATAKGYELMAEKMLRDQYEKQ